MSRSTFIVCLCCAVLWALIAQANHYLAPLNISLFVCGLFVTFAALRLPFREGWWAMLLTGLFLDTPTPVPLGLHAVFFLLTHAIVFNLRQRIPREETLIAVVVALLSNLGIFLAISLVFSNHGPFATVNWIRLMVDLVASQIVIVAIGPWFFALQGHALEFCGVSLRRDQRGML
jgi:rod shape-determining protein MreD